jgi:hypothetical protein
MGHPRIAQCVVSHGIRALGRGGTQIDPTTSLRKLPYVACPRACVCHVGLVYTPTGFVIDSNVHDTLRYE